MRDSSTSWQLCVVRDRKSSTGPYFESVAGCKVELTSVRNTERQEGHQVRVLCQIVGNKESSQRVFVRRPMVKRVSGKKCKTGNQTDVCEGP